MGAKEVELTGRITREARDVGSKSEHEAVVLKTGDGQSYALRERNANPFEPGSFDQLEGASITARGLDIGNDTMIVDAWHKVEDDKP